MSTGSLKATRKPSRAPPPPPLPSSDYILISSCSTGLYKGTTRHSVHQKSNSEYSYLDLDNKSQNSRKQFENSAPSTPNDIDYKSVDFLKTDALIKCKAERTKTK